MSSTLIPIVFVHIGDAPPEYSKIAVQQARRWNPHTPIVFLSSTVVKSGYGAGEEWVSIANIPKSREHTRFDQTTLLDTTFRNGFWRFTTERLFVLYDWMIWKGIDECIHIENDNTLYYNIDEILPQLRENSKGISATFHGQGFARNRVDVCYSFIHCDKVESLSQFLFFLAASPSGVDEMQRGGLYWLENEDTCSIIPCVPPGSKLLSENFRNWCENAKFPCVFDAMSHGQYVGGEDPRNGPGNVPGGKHINLDAEFRPDQFLYGWKADIEGRRYPVITDRRGKEWRIVNLHIHSKRLEQFV